MKDIIYVFYSYLCLSIIFANAFSFSKNNMRENKNNLCEKFIINLIDKHIISDFQKVLIKQISKNFETCLCTSYKQIS